MGKKSSKNIAGNYYDKHNSKNPIVQYLMRNFHNKLFKAIRLIRPRNILDIGCGEGYTTRLIHRKFPKVKMECIELESKIIPFAKKNNPDIKISQGSIYSIKRKSDSFDIVMASEVLEHVKSPNKAAKEARRVARKYCIFSVPYEPFWRMVNMARGAYWSDLGNTPGHIQHWGKSSFRKMLKRHFRKVTIVNAILWNIAICKK